MGTAWRKYPPMLHRIITNQTMGKGVLVFYPHNRWQINYDVDQFQPSNDDPAL
jgi:hypothetical protein